ncbi:MAG: prepilin-type N-terminal cleavage/methylation domain-containing protein [Desulfobacteraceae bacterium]
MRTKTNKGFTLLEIMVVVVLISILAAVATPQINQAFDSYQFSNGMRMVLNTINRAKGEAMNSGLFTSVNFTTDANGRVNYTAFVDDGIGGGITRNGIRDGAERLITAGRLPTGVSIIMGNTTFQRVGANPFTQFNYLGMPNGTDPANGAALINYSGDIMFSSLIRGIARTQTIQIGVGGSLGILR